MLGRLTDFVEELRTVGVPVSMVEALDASEALRHVDLSHPGELQDALAATLVKNQRHRAAFDIAFDVFFGLRPRPSAQMQRTTDASEQGSAEGGGTGGAVAGEGDGLSEAVADALSAGDMAALRELVSLAVDRFAGMEPGRPVGGRYYLYRVMRRLDEPEIGRRIREGIDEVESDLDRRLVDEEVEDLLGHLRDEVRQEITRRLVEDRGEEDVARTLRVPLVEDVDLMHATREELARVERAITPLARKLATRLAQRRRRGRRGRLDVRRTIRRSLAHGGALLEPSFRHPRTSKPDLVLLCDVSGSMATFARFTMQLTYAIGAQFARVRTFAFIDGVDEVTPYFTGGADFVEGLARMGREARLVHRDGHSDYGNVLTEFVARYPDAVTPRSTVIVTGDARNNYRPSQSRLLEALGREARALFWLNPEARRYWDTGDSIMSQYTPHCDGVYEVRTLRQLETFVEQVALPSGGSLRRLSAASAA